MAAPTAAGFLSDPLNRRIFGLALPALGALLVQPIYSLTDVAIVGHLGPVPLAAVAVAGAGLNIVGWLGGFLQMSTVSAVAFRRGSGDASGAGAAVGAAYLVAVALGVASAAALFAAAPLLTGLLGAHGATGAQADTYVRIASVGLPVQFASLAGAGHLTGLADTRRPFRIALASNAVNVTLEVVLVYAVHLGVAGSAWGTVGAQVVSAALFTLVSRGAPVPPGRPRVGDVAELAAGGVRLVIRTVALGGVLLASTAVAARLGTTRLGGHQIALQVWQLLALGLDSLAVPAQVFVGEALGAGDVAGARRVGRATMRIGLVCGVAAGAVTVAVSGVLSWLFSSDPGVRAAATTALVVCGAQQPAAAAAFVLDGLLLGASQFRVLQWATIAAAGAFAPLAAATARDHHLGLVGVWSALACWLTARAVILGWRWSKGGWSRGVSGRQPPCASTASTTR